MSVVWPIGPRLTAAQCVEGMAAGLYEELFTAVVSLINRYGHKLILKKLFRLIKTQDGFREHVNTPEQRENMKV